MYYELVLLAAGQGKRMKASRNKILLHLLGKPVIIYALEAFLRDPICQRIIVVVQENEETYMREILKKYLKKKSQSIDIVIGGKERQDSVYRGLQAVRNQQGFVFIHDGARPFVNLRLLKDLYKKVEVNKAAIVGVPVKDTIKRVSNGVVEDTIPRESLWQIQTPQAFICQEIREAHEQAQREGFVGTDDASLMERYGKRKVQIVLGSYENIKLTTPDDMIAGEAILKRRLK